MSGPFTLVWSGPPPSGDGRFYRGYEWRTLVTDLNSNPITLLDNLAAQRTITYALNRPAVATGVVPSDDRRVNIPYVEPSLDAPNVSFNDRLLYMFRREAQGSDAPWVCRFAGVLEQIEDAAQEDQPYSTYTAFDPWQYLFARPIFSGTGLVGSNGISWDDTRGDVIVAQLLENTVSVHGPARIIWTESTFDATAQIDINFQQGLSVGAALQQLCATNTLDIVFEPIYDPINDPGVCCEVHVYAQAGTTRDDAVFSWDVGRAVTGISSFVDGDQMANTVQFYAGQGGPPVAPATDPLSEARYGVWYASQFFPGSLSTDAAQRAAQEFSLNRFAEYVLDLRKQGRRTVTLSPNPLIAPIPLLDYELGDRVPVYATDRLRQALPWNTDPTVYTRIYGIPVTLSDDGVERVERLLASPDGFS